MKEKGREEKLKAPPAPLVLPPKDVALPLFSPTAAMRITAVLPSLTPVLPEKLFEEKEKPKEKERKKDKKEKKKKKEKEKEKEKKEKEREKEKREREKREKEKERHKHEKVSTLPLGPRLNPVLVESAGRASSGLSVLDVNHPRLNWKLVCNVFTKFNFNSQTHKPVISLPTPLPCPPYTRKCSKFISLRGI